MRRNSNNSRKRTKNMVTRRPRRKYFKKGKIEVKSEGKHFYDISCVPGTIVSLFYKQGN